MTAELNPDFYDVNSDIYDERQAPVTPCPDWCEEPKHQGEGKFHEGAVTKVDGLRWVPNFNPPQREWADSHVSIDLETGIPALAVNAEYVNMDAAGAREFAAGLLRAADLYERLTKG